MTVEYQARVAAANDRLVVTTEPSGTHRWSSFVAQMAIALPETRTLSDSSIDIPANQAHVLKRAAEEWPGLTFAWCWDRPAELLASEAVLRNEELNLILNGGDVSDADLDGLQENLDNSGFIRRLLPRQAKAVAQLMKTRSGANFSVPGAGKTTMTYALYSVFRSLEIIDRMIVVAPLSAHEAWELEATEVFEPGRQPRVAVAPTDWPRTADVVVINYERASHPATLPLVESWLRGRHLMVVFDEAHRAKAGTRSIRGEAAINLARLATVRMPLTGTPMPNSIDDLGVVLDLAWPGAGFRLASGDLADQGTKTWVRITKDELELKPVDFRFERIKLDPEHQRLYDAVANDVDEVEQEPTARAEARLATRAILRLIAATTNPTLLLTEPELLQWPRHRRSSSTLEELLAGGAGGIRSAKLLRAAQIVAGNMALGKKTLIWTNFLSNVVELQRLLEPHNPAVIVGSTPVSDETVDVDRQRELRRFRTDPTCGVLIATPQTLGEGVSLHKVCQDQIHVDRTFSAGLFLQAIDRTHRVGMPDGTTARVHVLCAEGTIDERVQEVLARKLSEMETSLNDQALSKLRLPDFDGVQSFDLLGDDEDARAEVQHLVEHFRTDRMC